MKKLLPILLLALLVLFTACGSPSEPKADGSVYLDQAAEVFTIDINPGVRVYVAENGNVLVAEPTNTDGEKLLSDLDVSAKPVEDALDVIIDAAAEMGYVSDEEDVVSVLISVEKRREDKESSSGRVQDAVRESFDKQDREAAIIEQPLYDIDEEKAALNAELALELGISEGKANVINTILEERPELDEKDLAQTDIACLGMILSGASDETRARFDTLENNVPKEFISEDAAKAAALASVNLKATDKLENFKISASIGGDRMEYVVMFYYDRCRHEITVSAVDGSIIDTYVGKPHSISFEEFLAAAGGNSSTSIVGGGNSYTSTVTPPTSIGGGGVQYQGGFSTQGGNSAIISPGDTAALFPSGMNPSGSAERKPISENQAVWNAINFAKIDRVDLRRTSCDRYEEDGNIFYVVSLRIYNGDEFEFVINAISGEVLKATKNGNSID